MRGDLIRCACATKRPTVYGERLPDGTVLVRDGPRRLTVILLGGACERCGDVQVFARPQDGEK